LLPRLRVHGHIHSDQSQLSICMLLLIDLLPNTSPKPGLRMSGRSGITMSPEGLLPTPCSDGRQELLPDVSCKAVSPSRLVRMSTTEGAVMRVSCASIFFPVWFAAESTPACCPMSGEMVLNGLVLVLSAEPWARQMVTTRPEPVGLRN